MEEAKILLNHIKGIKNSIIYFINYAEDIWQHYSIDLVQLFLL